MTATRGIVATIVVATLIAAGTFYWFNSRHGCPDAYVAGTTYSGGDEVTFAFQTWRTDAVQTNQVPGPTSTDWTVTGTC